MDINTYIPILRTKRSEHIALKNMSLESGKKFTPLYEYRKISSKEKEAKTYSLKNHIEKIAKNCAESWDSSMPIIFDTPGFQNTDTIESGENAIEYFFKELAAYELNLIPAITTDRDTNLCKKLSIFSKSFVFRVQADDLNTPQETADTIEAQQLSLGVQKKTVILF